MDTSTPLPDALDSGTTTSFKTWLCVLCGFIYREADGLLGDGIAPGTLWSDVQADWVCPECGGTKADFEMVEV
ncbi:rubredoxin [Paraburkholderia hospita]|uniref:rubredoxin n=1 Tax=Paraburkholderia hospita TaxID=169430 RepID=UPI000DEF3618|nr:rubredoxin [Paraburkholderia hospita]AXF05894.1 rubredoxin [Paraburkholderia hospita]